MRLLIAHCTNMHKYYYSSRITWQEKGPLGCVRELICQKLLIENEGIRLDGLFFSKSTCDSSIETVNYSHDFNEHGSALVIATASDDLNQLQKHRKKSQVAAIAFVFAQNSHRLWSHLQ